MYISKMDHAQPQYNHHLRERKYEYVGDLE